MKEYTESEEFFRGSLFNPHDVDAETCDICDAELEYSQDEDGGFTEFHTCTGEDEDDET